MLLIVPGLPGPKWPAGIHPGRARHLPWTSIHSCPESRVVQVRRSFLKVGRGTLCYSAKRINQKSTRRINPFYRAAYARTALVPPAVPRCLSPPVIIRPSYENTDILSFGPSSVLHHFFSTTHAAAASAACADSCRPHAGREDRQDARQRNCCN